jgi:palmitoyl-protein thioesterase
VRSHLDRRLTSNILLSKDSFRLDHLSHWIIYEKINRCLLLPQTMVVACFIGSKNHHQGGMAGAFLFLLFTLIVCSISIYAKIYRPVVLMHGITTTASDMYELAGWINETFPGIYVLSVEIGNGRDDSFLLPMTRQVELFCATIRADPHLQQGFNMLGFSQGSLIVRAAVERCSLPVYNLITLSGINQGVFGVPNLQQLPPPFRELISEFVYEDAIQDVISIAGYWRDPYQLDKYMSRCRFLPDINNELSIRNETYKINMLKLNAFVMTYSDVDETVAPPLSGWFLGYQPKSIQVELWNQSRQFTEDLIGLRTLWEQGKIYRFTTHVPHGSSDHGPNKDFIFQNIMPFFNNTFPEL